MDYLTAKRLIGWNDHTIADFFLVSLETARRWRKEQQTPPSSVVKLLVIMAGRMPWDGWQDYRVTAAGIVAPGSARPVSPGDVNLIDIYKQRAEHLERIHSAPAQYLLDL